MAENKEYDKWVFTTNGVTYESSGDGSCVVSRIVANDNVKETCIPEYVEVLGKKYAIKSIWSNAGGREVFSHNVSTGDSVGILGYQAFSHCGFSEVTVGASVRSIGEGSFENCCFLSTINLPKSLAAVGQDAFYGCNHLSVVNYAGTKEDRGRIAIDSGNSCLLNAEWHYAEGAGTENKDNNETESDGETIFDKFNVSGQSVKKLFGRLSDACRSLSHNGTLGSLFGAITGLFDDEDDEDDECEEDEDDEDDDDSNTIRGLLGKLFNIRR